jgi:tRNA-dihydrouridine synthase 3
MADVIAGEPPAAVAAPGDDAAAAAAAAPAYAAGAGWCAVRPQFLVPKATYLAQLVERSARAAVAYTETAPASEPPAKRARGGGQNKSRKAAEMGYGAGGANAQFCRAVMLGRTCRFGAKCRDSHDLAGFLAAKPADLGPACYVFAAHGACPAGVSCRFGDSHTDRATGAQVAGAGASAGGQVFAPAAAGPTAAGGGARPEDRTYNHLSGDLMHALTRKRYAYLRSSTAGGGELRGGSGGGGSGGGGGGGGGAGAAAAAAASATVTATVATTTTNSSGSGEAPAAVAAATSDAAEAANATTATTTTSTATVTSATVTISTASSAPPLAAAAGSAGGHDDAADARDAAAGAAGARSGAVRRDGRFRMNERRSFDFAGRLYVGPLTTVGNLPFRRVMVEQGADVTIGEMALAGSVVEGSPSEWALLRRHSSERAFGVQLAGAYPDVLARAAELIHDQCDRVDFIDLNMGCPLDTLCSKGACVCVCGWREEVEWGPRDGMRHVLTQRCSRQLL